MIYFCAKNNGFYNSELHTSIPEHSIEISQQLYEQLIFGQSNGQTIVTDEQGMPFLIPKQPSQAHVWNGKEWVVDEQKQAELKAEQQAQVWEAIKQKRYQNSLGGVFIESIGKWFQTGEEEKTKYLGLAKVIEQLGELDWKTCDNSFVKMNKALLDEIFVAMVVTENADHINAEKHRLAMLEVDEPLNYDYSTGWSANYEENNK